MRRLIAFECEGARLAASLDAGSGATGMLIVTGGSQTRIGSHRMFAELAAALAADGAPVFRFDRRGVGDSEGEDPGFRGNEADIRAAAAAFREQVPTLHKVIGFGLCDGATSLALFSGAAGLDGLDGLILVNPWFVEAASGEPPAAAIKQHYRRQLASLEGWRKLLGGAVSYRKIFAGLKKIAAPGDPGLASAAGAALARSRLPTGLVLCRGDGTAVAAEDAWKSAAFQKARPFSVATVHVESDSHTFARPGDMDALIAACRDLLRRLEG